jgi:bifunctional NMN adenylyltransferase/nudix hydrolase
METIQIENYPIGVIIGRFQAHELHEGHRMLIDLVVKNHKKTILFVGCSSVLNSKRNPLDFETRKRMILKSYPELNVIPIYDKASDNVWSKEIDTKIKEVFPMGKPLLYGSRDSFIKYYTGNHTTFSVESDILISATELRKNISRETKESEDFRKGVIYQAHNRYPVSYQTVDIAVINEAKDSVLLARKPNETLYRFVGGFVDPTDESLEVAAARELSEETGGNGNFDKMTYFSSHRVDDWRYRSEVDKILTSLFVTTHLWGSLEPSDDIAELRWFKLETLAPEFPKFIVKEHIPLFTSLLLSKSLK